MATQITSDPRAREKPCLRCGYSLRQNIEARHCPECGLSVWLSLSPDDVLERSNPSWVARLALATTLLAATQAAAAAALAGDLFADLIASLAERIPVSLLATFMFGTGGYLAVTGGAMLLLASCENRYPDDLKGWRKLTMSTGASATVFGIVWTACGLAALLTGFRLWGMYSFWESSAGLLAVASGAATLAYLRQIARRLPSPATAHLCEWLMIVLALLLVFVLPWVGRVFWAYLGEIAAYIALGYLLASCALLARLAWSFRKARQAAQRLWESETAPRESLGHS